ncbi:HNH endonuclease [Acinetobacter sp.]|uniref:HNH endonuclease n=1 Tax=Acinetobacter sp. TaxID=472 RepID=UPI0037506659
MIKNCEYCKKEFEADNYQVKIGWAKFCSRECGLTGGAKKRNPRIPNTVCAYCEKSFYKKECMKKYSKCGLYFCSRACRGMGMRYDISLIPFKNRENGNIDSRTYRKIAFKDREKKCNRCGYQKHIRILQVHHIDRNRKNNKYNNLEILCPTCHAEEHLVI